MTPATSNIENLVGSIVELIRDDEQIDHCRVNIVNGSSDVFMKYKRNLGAIEDREEISVRFYKTTKDLHQDLFYEKDFMADNWFNLFAFNLNYCKHICVNPDCENYNKATVLCSSDNYCKDVKCLATPDVTVEEMLMMEIHGVNLILHELSAKFDSKFYASTLVSMMPIKLIHRTFEEATGEECPIKSLRYLDFDFDGEEILTYMYKILKTHSTEFLQKWDSALKKLEKLSSKASS
jgi:hypothetical protein